MTKAATLNGPVTTRFVGPNPVEDGDLTALLREAPQVDGKPQFKVTFRQVTPQQARQYLDFAETFEDFRQRKTKPQDVRRWANLMCSKRFVEYLPNGPLCFDPEGVLLNGKHRMTALGYLADYADADLDPDKVTSLGMMVVSDVPRWMFRYFDTGRTRTLNDVLEISGKFAKANTGSAMRAAMRYEEYLNGLRKATGWRDWGQHRDEHADVDFFYTKRGSLNDYYAEAQRVYHNAGMVIASGMLFRFYQELAWPEGLEHIETFWDGLSTGANLAPRSPLLELREWGKANKRERIAGKRELHVMLLFKHFDLSMRGSKIERVNWAFGMPMVPPYHPGGAEVAMENVRKGLAKLDRRAAKLMTG
jgi:hypothetical protein